MFVPVFQLASGVWVYVAGKLQDQLPLALASFGCILDTILVTIASVQLQEQTLNCALDQTWRSWFQNKDGITIRDIQNRLECCGFKSPVDKGWPLPDKNHGKNACHEMYGHEHGCLMGWSRVGRTTLATLLVIGVVSFLIKVTTILRKPTIPDASELRSLNFVPTGLFHSHLTLPLCLNRRPISSSSSCPFRAAKAVVRC